MDNTTLAFLAVLAALFAFRIFMARRSPAQVAEMRSLIADGGLLLDVRTPDEYRREHLPGAVNIPVQVLSGRLGELDDRSRAVVVYCHSGARSRAAAGLLRSAGFERVLDLGAMGNWHRG